jgi:hypothetical protein
MLRSKPRPATTHSATEPPPTSPDQATAAIVEVRGCGDHLGYWMIRGLATSTGYRWYQLRSNS